MEGIRSERQGTGNREQATGNREQGTGNREQATGNRQQGIGPVVACGRLAGKKSAAGVRPAANRFLASTVFALCLFHLMQKIASRLSGLPEPGRGGDGGPAAAATAVSIGDRGTRAERRRDRPEAAVANRSWVRRGLRDRPDRPFATGALAGCEAGSARTGAACTDRE